MGSKFIQPSKLLSSKLNGLRIIHGLQVWVIIFLFATVFLFPYFISSTFLTHFTNYGSLALLPLGLAAYFRSYRGVLIVWVSIILGIAISLWINLGLIWSGNTISAFISGNVVGLVAGLSLAHFFRMHRQIVAARLDARDKELEIVQQRQARELQERLNELKDELILNLTHELRTPLTEIYGYLELLQNYRHMADEAQQTLFLANALHGCDELMELVNSLLDVNKVDESNLEVSFEAIPVARFVEKLVTQLNPQVLNERKITLEISEELLVRANQQYLRRILRNLLSNAAKYSPPDSQIIISAALNDENVQETHGCSQICLSIKDEGPGISAAEIPLLFQKFVRLKRDLSGPVRGTGLGLYITRQLVELLNGHIWIESSGKAGEGSRFCFTLPSATAYPVDADRTELTTR